MAYHLSEPTLKVKACLEENQKSSIQMLSCLTLIE